MVKAGSTARLESHADARKVRNENLIQLADLRKHNALLLLERKQVPSV